MSRSAYAISYFCDLFAVAYIDFMEIPVRTPAQAGAAIRRIRRLHSLTQSALGARMRARQATVSKLEAGEPATELRTLMNALAALGLEIVIRPRATDSSDDLGDLV